MIVPAKVYTVRYRQIEVVTREYSRPLATCQGTFCFLGQSSRRSVNEKLVWPPNPPRQKKRVGVVLSNHCFTKTPSCDEMIAILCEEQSLGAEVAKLAVMPNTSGDVLALLDATNKMYTEHVEIPLITISMGAMGLASRLCGGLFGSAAHLPLAPVAMRPRRVKSISKNCGRA